MENIREEKTVQQIVTNKHSARRFCRMLSWMLMILLIMIVVPVGIVMFVVSGIWSAADRALLKINS